MRYLWLLLCPLLLCCRLDDCGVLIHSAQTYQGTGTEPYLEQLDFYTRSRSCASNQCTHDTITTIALHNPTGKAVRAQYRCSFRSADQELSYVKPSPVKVPARSTRKVDVEGFVDVLSDYGADLSTECTATFR